MFMLNVSHLENHARSCWIIGFLNAVFSTLLMIFSCLLWYCPIMMIFSILLATASKSNWLSSEKKLSFASASFIFCNRRTTNQRWLTFLAIRSLGQLEFDTPRPRKRVGSPTGFRQWFSWIKLFLVNSMSLNGRIPEIAAFFHRWIPLFDGHESRSHSHPLPWFWYSYINIVQSQFFWRFLAKSQKSIKNPLCLVVIINHVGHLPFSFMKTSLHRVGWWENVWETPIPRSHGKSTHC